MTNKIILHYAIDNNEIALDAGEVLSVTTGTTFIVIRNKRKPCLFEKIFGYDELNLISYEQKPVDCTVVRFKNNHTIYVSEDYETVKGMV